MKVAFMVSGECRGLELTYQNQLEMLFDNFPNHDLFAYIRYDENCNKFERFFIPTVVEYKPDIDINMDGLSFHPNSRNHYGYLQMLYGRKKVNELRLKYQQDNNISYDYVFYVRLDVRYFEKIEKKILENLDKNKIYVPDFHWFSFVQNGGYNDRFAIGSDQNMSQYCSQYDFIREHNIKIQAESFLYKHLNHFNIKVEPIRIRFGRVRSDGSEEDYNLRDEKTWNWYDGM